MVDRPIDILAQANEPVASEWQTNSILRRVDERIRQDDIANKTAVDVNTRVPAAEQAKAIPVAKENNIPVDVARRNLRGLEEQKQRDNFLNIIDRKGALSKLAADPTHGPIAVENADELNDLEQRLNVYKMGTVERTARGLSQSFIGGFEDDELMVLGSKVMEGTATPEDEKRAAEIEASQKKRTDYQLGFTGQVFQSVAGSAPGMANTMLGAVDEALIGGAAATAMALPGSVGPQGAATLPSAFLLGAGWGARYGYIKESYKRLSGGAFLEARSVLDANGNPLDAQTVYGIAATAGTIGALVEIIPVQKATENLPFLNGIAGKQGAKWLAEQAAKNPALRGWFARVGRIAQTGGAEAFAELVQEVAQLESIIAAGGVTSENGGTLADQRGERYTMATVAGAAGGMTFAGAGEALTAVEQRVSQMRLDRADAKKQALIELGDKIRNSKTGAMSPETIVAHARQIDADGGGPQMSAPAEALITLFQSEGLTAEQIQTQFPEVVAALDDGAQSNAEVPLNAETIVKLAKLEGFTGLAEDIRTAPGEFTAREAKEQGADFDTLIADVSEEDQKAAVKASAESEVTKQMVATGMEQRVAETNARLHVSVLSRMSEASGKSIDTLMQEFPLQIVREGMEPGLEGGMTLSQADVLARSPELQDAMRKLQAGEITRADYAALVDKVKPVAPYAAVPEPASREAMQSALTEDKVPKVGLPDQLPDGHPVGLRLDIPAYARHNTWVVSVHEQKSGFAAGQSIGYSSVARATNVELGVVQNAAANIAGGKPKATIAVMKGSWKQTTPEQAKVDADAALKDPAWRQIGMDPERHAYFYDRETMQPITNAEEVIQIGPLVLGKNVTYGDTDTFLFQSDTPLTPEEELDESIDDLEGELEDEGFTGARVDQIDALVDDKDIPVITLIDLIGKKIFPTIADRTAAAALYTGIDGSKLSIAIPLLGGPYFPLRVTNWLANVVWANRGKGVTSQKAARLKDGANYMLVVMGDANMHQSNTTVSRAFFGTLEAYARDGRVAAEGLAALSKMVTEKAASMDPVVEIKAKNTKALEKAAARTEPLMYGDRTLTATQDVNKKLAKMKADLAAFPGFADEKVLDDYLDGISFDARKEVLRIMGTKEAKAFGVPSMEKILAATIQPQLAGHRWGDGVLLVELDQTNPQVDLGTEGTTQHPDFPLGIRGKVVGKLNTPLNYETLWADWLHDTEWEANSKNIAEGTPDKPVNVRRAFELSKPIVEVTQALVDRIGKLAPGNIESHRQARLAADFALGNWRDANTAVKSGGLSVQGFIDALAASDASATLTPPGVGFEGKGNRLYSEDEVEKRDAIYEVTETVYSAASKETGKRMSAGVEIKVVDGQPRAFKKGEDITDQVEISSSEKVLKDAVAVKVDGQVKVTRGGQDVTNQVTAREVQTGDFTFVKGTNERVKTLDPAQHLERQVKNGTLEIKQLGDGEIYYALKDGNDYGWAGVESLPGDKTLTSVVNNEQGARGIAGPAVLIDSLENGATLLDCFAVKSEKFPGGFLPALYGEFGFEIAATVPFDPEQFSGNLKDAEAYWESTGWKKSDGYPDVVVMRWKGADADRKGIRGRYIRSGIKDILGRRAAEHAPAVEAFDRRHDRPAPGKARPGADAGGVAGVQGNARPSLASRAQSIVRDLGNLTDAEARNLGLTAEDRDKVATQLNENKAPSPGPSSSEGTTTLYQSDLSFYDPSLKPLIKARDVKAVAIRTVDQLLQIADGMKTWRDWYARYEQVLIDFLGSPEEAQLFQDILSATSQAASVKANVGLAIRAYDLMKSGQPFTGYLPAVIINLNRVREKQAIQGRKIGQYGEASNGNTDAIAVDRHIAMVIFGVKAPSPKQIEQAKGMIREIAARLGWAAREVQAALWAGNQILLGTPEEKIGSYDDVLLKKGEPLKQLFRDIQSRNGDVRGAGGSSSQVGATASGAGEAQAGEGQQRLDQVVQSRTPVKRGFIEIAPGRTEFKITLTGKADLSTYQHEAAHYYLEVLQALVERGSASPEMAADLEKIRAWTGLKPNEKIEVRHHEMFARGWEAYLMEGRAPSNELQGTFNRFRAWMVFVYKRMTALDVQLTDEVRSVFDRLVASDEAIAEARTSVGVTKPLPKTALYLSDDEYDRYVEAWNKANEEQQRELDGKLMREAAQETRQAWKEERARLIKEETDALSQTRGWRAWKLLSEGLGLEDVAPGRTAIKIDPETVPGEWRRDTTGMTEEGGLPIDFVAEFLGFNSGEEMISLIAGAKMAERDIPRKVIQQMKETHGHMDAVQLADAAIDAVHDDKGQEVLLTEYRAMAAKAGIGAPPKGLAQWMAAQASQKVMALTKRQLDPTRWRRAELSAAQKAAAAKDPAQASIHKRQQMMARAMYKATTDASKRVDVIRNKLTPFTKNDRRAKLGKAGDLYLDGIDEILEAIQLKPMSAASIQKLDRLQKLVEEADKNGEPLVLPNKLRAMLGKKNFADMTLEELEGVHDAVMNIWHLAKLKNELKARNEKRQLDEALTEMEANAQAALGDPEVTVKFTKGWKDRAAATMRSFRAGLTKAEFLFGWLDGKPDGGLMHRLLYQPLADANKAKFDILKRFHETLIERMRNMPNEQKARWEAKRTFMGNPTANGATIISAALNLGNEGNKKKLLEGYGWNEQRLMAEINGFMTKADWDLVQHVWDEINTLWPKIEATTKAATGLAPKKVVAAPVQTPFGTYAGGYYPVVYDPDQTEQQFKNQQENAGLFTNNFARPTLGDGFTEGRVDYAAPILLELSVISRHLAEVVHYVTHYEAITQADKITRHPRFQAVVTGHMGKEFYRTIRPWLQDIARDQDTPAITKTEPFAMAMRYLRGGVSIGAMGYNIFTGVKQLMGVVQSLDAIGPKYWLSGLTKSWMSPNAVKNWKFAFANSQELEPLVTQFDRDIKMINDAYAKQGTMSIPAKVSAAAFAHIGWLQSAVNVATWHGAYEQEIARSGDHDKAVMHADAVIRQTQSAGAVKDLSPIQRGSEINRAVSMFYSWFNVLYNRLEGIAKETKGIRDVPRAAMRVAILVMITSMIEEAGRRAWEGVVDNYDDDDEERGYILSVLMKSADTLIGAIPLARAFISAEAATGGMKPEITPVGRVTTDYYRSMSAVFDLIANQEAPSRSEAKTVVRTISTLTQVPLSGPYNFLDELFGETVFDERKKKN